MGIRTTLHSIVRHFLPLPSHVSKSGLRGILIRSARWLGAALTMGPLQCSADQDGSFRAAHRGCGMM
jgi:hypothetical protein